MKQRHDPLLWVEFAEQDWKAMQALIAGPEPLYGIICFHGQQCGEKYLKAFLAAKGNDPPLQHDLRKLLADCVTHESKLAALQADCSVLNAWATAPRYPSLSIRPGSNDAAQALQAAERIRNEIRQRLGL